MSFIHFTVEKDGFCGLFLPITENRKAAVIMLEDGPPDSYLVKTALKWLNRSGVSAMGVGPEKSMKGVHNWPLENVENAVHLLKSQGYDPVYLASYILHPRVKRSERSKLRMSVLFLCHKIIKSLYLPISMLRVFYGTKHFIQVIKINYYYAYYTKSMHSLQEKTVINPALNPSNLQTKDCRL